MRATLRGQHPFEEACLRARHLLGRLGRRVVVTGEMQQRVESVEEDFPIEIEAVLKA